MKTGQIGHNPAQFASQTHQTQKPGTGDISQVINAVANPIDTFTPSLQNRPGIAGAQNPQAIQSLWRETNHQADAIRRLVRNMIGQTDATGQGFWAARAQGGFSLSEADRLEAERMVSDDGFFGASQTTDRIMGFAKALVGEGASESQIEAMRAAVQEGFDQVARMFGGFDNLPEVTRNTHAAIMQSFDDWLGIGQKTTET